jgi:FHS family L-fucose permease-like MFS transporter
MSIVGGAIIPAVMGRISDATNIQMAFVVPLICHAYILYFALRGFKPLTVATANTLLSIAQSAAE